MMRSVESPAKLRAQLDDTGYLCDEGLATIAWLALELGRPLLLEGSPGTGKTALAEALSEALQLPIIRLQCFEGIDSSQALYDWDFPRQILHLRAAEAASRAGTESTEKDLERSLYDEHFLVARPLLQALQKSPCVLLIDEVDRADSEFEAFLLEVLATYQVSIPEIGTIRAQQPPIVVLTSNRTRELHDALKRRCMYHWIEHPSAARELAIVRARLSDVPTRLAAQVVTMVQELRADPELTRAPGVAETLEWVRALQALGLSSMDTGLAVAAAGVVAKHPEDLLRVRASVTARGTGGWG